MNGDTSPTILIVDDEPSNVDLLEAILTPDYSILKAYTGTEGLQMATTQHSDLILLDIMLPDISGHDICRKLKNTDGTRLIPIIMITALVDKEEKIRSLEEGADDFINKPTKASVIRKRVHSLLTIKILRDKLIQERNLARKYIDVAGSPMLTIGRDLRVHLANHKACKILGYDNEDIVGKNWFDTFIPEDETDKQREYFLELLKEPVGLPDTIQNTVITKSGDRKLIEWHYVVLKDEDKKLTEILISGEDITACKMEEDELARAHYELKNIDKMRNEFIANMSHELRTPLVSMKGFSELLYSERLGELNQEQKSALNSIVRNTDILKNLVESLFYVTTAPGEMLKEKVRYTSVPIDMKDIVMGAIQDVSQQASTKDITVHICIPQNLPHICGNRNYIERVFLHLMDIMIDITPEGNRIDLSATADDGTIHINIISNIQEGTVPMDLCTNDTDKAEGDICRNIIEAHNGRIWIDETDHVMNIHIELHRTPDDAGQC